MLDVWAARDEQPICSSSTHPCITRATGTQGWTNLIKITFSVNNSLHFNHYIVRGPFPFIDNRLYINWSMEHTAPSIVLSVLLVLLYTLWVRSTLFFFCGIIKNLTKIHKIKIFEKSQKLNFFFKKKILIFFHFGAWLLKNSQMRGAQPTRQISLSLNV